MSLGSGDGVNISDRARSHSALSVNQGLRPASIRTVALRDGGQALVST